GLVIALLEGARTLKHTAVDQKAGARSLDEKTGAGDDTGRSVECNPHSRSSQVGRNAHRLLRTSAAVSLHVEPVWTPRSHTWRALTDVQGKTVEGGTTPGLTEAIPRKNRENRI